MAVVYQGSYNVSIVSVLLDVWSPGACISMLRIIVALDLKAIHDIVKKVRNISMFRQIIYRATDKRGTAFNIELAGISICDGTYYVRRTNSKIYVFEYIYAGKGIVNVNGSSSLLKAGDIYILPQGSNHEYYSDSTDKWRKIWFTATGVLIDQLLKAYNLTNVYWIRGLDLRRLFVEVFTLLKTSQPDHNNRSALILHNLIIECASRLRTVGKQITPDAAAIKNYLDANIMNAVSLGKISKHVHKSPSQVIRTFKKAYEVTPYEYVILERINTAKILLVDHAYLSVKEVAFMLNFADEHYFSNVFKSKVGISPSMYKQTVKNEAKDVVEPLPPAFRDNSFDW